MSIILWMPHNKDHRSIIICNDMNSSLLRLYENLQIFYFFNILLPYLSISRMWSPKFIIDSSKQWMRLVVIFVFKNSKYFLLNMIFLYTIMMIQSCLSSPAQKKSSSYFCFYDIHYFNQFFPIYNLLKSKCFYGSSCNNKAIKPLFHSIKKIFIKKIKM